MGSATAGIRISETGEWRRFRPDCCDIRALTERQLPYVVGDVGFAEKENRSVQADGFCNGFCQTGFATAFAIAHTPTTNGEKMAVLAHHADP